MSTPLEPAPTMSAVRPRRLTALAALTLTVLGVASAAPPPAQAAKVGLEVLGPTIYFSKGETAAIARDGWKFLTVCSSAVKLNPWAGLVCAADVASVSASAHFAQRRGQCLKATYVLIGGPQMRLGAYTSRYCPGKGSRPR